MMDDFANRLSSAILRDVFRIVFPTCRCSASLKRLPKSTAHPLALRLANGNDVVSCWGPDLISGGSSASYSLSSEAGGYRRISVSHESLFPPALRLGASFGGLRRNGGQIATKQEDVRVVAALSHETLLSDSDSPAEPTHMTLAEVKNLLRENAPRPTPVAPPVRPPAKKERGRPQKGDSGGPTNGAPASPNRNQPCSPSKKGPKAVSWRDRFLRRLKSSSRANTTGTSVPPPSSSTPCPIRRRPTESPTFASPRHFRRLFVFLRHPFHRHHSKRTARDTSPSSFDEAGHDRDTGAMAALSSCLPSSKSTEATDSQEVRRKTIATCIDEVKDRGWYWGPVSSSAAQRILESEPDGTFFLRDSSDKNYIFSLTFKLNGTAKHVRIEHVRGQFTFDSNSKFQAPTIVDFVEKSIRYSRDGRYLFFVRRIPGLGPLRVQLLRPLSRFKQVQSLQHLCRYTIMKCIHLGQVHELPLPIRLIEYLNTPYFYVEHVASLEEEEKQKQQTRRRLRRVETVEEGG